MMRIRSLASALVLLTFAAALPAQDLASIEKRVTVRKLDNGSYSVDGRTPLGLVNEALDSGFESEDFDTIGGLVLGQLGRPPEVGDELVLDGYDLRVDEVDGQRVAQVVVRERGEEDGAGEQHSE